MILCGVYARYYGTCSWLTTSPSQSMSRCKLVYWQLYKVNVARRFSSDWNLELERQIQAMRKVLAFMLDPCVERILDFLDAGIDSDSCYVALRSSRSIDTVVVRRVARFLDQRFSLRTLIRSACLDWYWRLGVKRPNDHRGDPASWRRACQECMDYLTNHSRCVSSSSSEKIDDLRNCMFTVFCDESAVAFWEKLQDFCPQSETSR